MGCEETPGVQALSSTESEIIQVVEACKELLWLQPLLLDLGYPDIDWCTVLNTNNDPATSVQQKSGAKTKSSSNSDTPPTPTTIPGSSKKQVQMVASVDRSNGTVFIRGGVNYPVTGGSCFAELSGPSGQSIRKDSVVLSNPNSTDCKTISIPEGDLASGKWTFTLNYTSDEYKGVSSEVSFTL